jgi:hypothetical protein
MKRMTQTKPLIQIICCESHSQTPQVVPRQVSYLLSARFFFQNAFMRFAAAARCAGENVRFFRAVFAAVVGGSETAPVDGWPFFDPGGRPRRLPMGAPKASMARFSLSRSAMSNASMWSVGILSDRSR